MNVTRLRGDSMLQFTDLESVILFNINFFNSYRAEASQSTLTTELQLSLPPTQNEPDAKQWSTLLKRREEKRSDRVTVSLIDSPEREHFTKPLFNQKSKHFFRISSPPFTPHFFVLSPPHYP